MVKTVDYNARKKEVLAATIKHYIDEAAPVSSEHIAKDFKLSSATIRNIFVKLEGDGYLTHPYTSGGRIPTHKGYRYYVDFLMREDSDNALSKEFMHEKETVIREYKRGINRLEDILEKTSQIVSEITHYTSLVSVLDWDNKFFYNGIGFILEQPEFRDFERIRFLIKMIEDKQSFLDIINRDFQEKVKIYIGEELGYEQINDCAMAVSSYRVRNKRSGRVAVLGPARMKYGSIVSVLEQISDILCNTLDEEGWE